MADKNRNIKFTITANAEQPKKSLEELNGILEKLELNRKKMIADGVAEGKMWDLNKAEIRDTKKQIRELEDNYETVQKVIADLANSSLPQLKKAFKEGQRAISKMSEDNVNLKPMQAALQEIQRQMDFITGKAKNVGKEIDNLDTKTDGWLASAKKDLKAYADSLDDIDDHYKEQLALIAKIEAEEKRRANAKSYIDIDDKMNNLTHQSEKDLKQMLDYMNKAKAELHPYSDEWIKLGEQIELVKKRMEGLANPAMYTKDYGSALHVAYNDRFNWNDGTSHDITKKDLQWSKDFLQKELENTPVADTAKIKEIQDAIENIDQRMKNLIATEQQVFRISGQAAQKVREVLRNPEGASGNDIKYTIEQLQKRIMELPAGSKAVAGLRRNVEMLQKTLKGVTEDVVDVNDVLKRSKQGKASIDELKKAYKQLEDELSHIKDLNDDAFKNGQKDLKDLKKQIDEVTGAANKQGNSWSTAAKNLVAYVGLFGAFNMLKTKITEAINGNLKYSDSLANIRKVSGLVKKDINDLSTQLAKIDTRTSQEELASIAYTGAKLGMGKYGTQGLVEFTEAANKVNVALKEDMGEDALKNLSKMVEVMGLIPKMGVEKSMMATSSALFKLASTSTSSADSVIEFSKRLTGMSRTAGITTDQLLALGSASDSMMLMPEVASTAFSKLIAQLQRAPGAIEESLQIPKGTIDNLYSSGKAMDAIVMILEKMKQKGNMNALDDVFKDLGSDGARLISVMVTMSKNVDMLKSHLYESKTAFEEATAVQDEYNIQQETAQALLEKANNIWEESFINPTQISHVEWMARAWYNVSKALSENQVFMLGLRGTMTSLYAVVAGFVALLPTLATALLMGGAAYAVKQWAEWVGGMKEKIEELKEAWEGLDKAVKTTSWVGLALTFASLIYNIYELVKATDKASEAQKKLSEYHAQGAANAAEETRKLDEYVRALESANTSQRTREQLIAQFNREYGSYLNKLGLEVNSVQDLRDAYSQLNDELKKSTMSRMRDQAYKDILDPIYAETHEKGVDIDQKLEKLGFGAINRRYMDNLYREIMSGEHVGEGVNVGNVASIANFIYNRSMRNKYGEQWNKKTNKVNVNNEGVVGGKGAKYNDEVNGVDLDELRKDILKYVNNKVIETRRKEQIDKEFEQDLAGWTNEEVEILGHLRDKPDPKAARAAAAQQKKEWRDQLKEAQSDANAIIDKIKNYYERQILEVTEKANSLNLDEAQTEALTRPIRAKMNDALAVARKAISNVEQGWDTFKQTMQDDMIEVMGENGLNESQMLLDQIEKADLKALQEKIATLSKSLNRPESALMDQIWRNATKNAQANADAERKQREEIQKILLEHNYTGIVDNNTTQQMEKIGAFALDAEQVKTLLGGDEAKAQKLLDDRATEIATLLKNAREHIVELYTTDVTTEEGRNSLMAMLFGDNWDQETSQLKAVFDLWGEDIQAFYLELLKYIDEYDAAQKKSDDERKKLNDYGWSKTDYATQYSKDMVGGQQYNDIMGSYRNAGERMGMADIASGDPELEMMKARMEYAEKYYQYLQEHNATEQQLADARKGIMDEQAAYAKKLTADMFEQYNALLDFISPLEQFGASVGDAFATMTEDAAAGRKAIKDALKQMIKSFATNTLQMISQQQIDRANTTAHYTELLLMQQAFAQAQLDAEIANGVAMIQAKQATNLSEEQLEGIHQQVMAALKSAGIFGWCVSALGPIAGPIAYGAMMSILMGLLNFAIGKIGGGSEANSASQAKGPNTKLVSGMLTYDQGNIQTVIGDNGKVYNAVEGKIPDEGVNLLTQPTVASVNGQQSLIAEEGPEFVIGRETTKAIMMRPDLLQQIKTLDAVHSGRGMRTYDRGNFAEVNAVAPDGNASGTVAGMAERDERMYALMAAILDRLNNPIAPEINMYGNNGLHKKIQQANQFMKGKG